MSDQVHVDLGRLPGHAADHRSIAGQWQEWPLGSETFLADFRRTHGAVAEPLALALEEYQRARAHFASSHSDAHHQVSDAIMASFGSYRTEEGQSSRNLTETVRDL